MYVLLECVSETLSDFFTLLTLLKVAVPKTKPLAKDDFQYC